MGRQHARFCALALCAALSAGVALAEPVCSASAVFLITPSGTQMRFSAEVADDVDERALGLMNREKLAASAAMLFVYPKPQRAMFWMKNTLIPLDLLFLDETGTVASVHAMAQPLDESRIDGGEDVKFVIEIDGGLAQKLGISPGTVMLHPSVAPGAAKWPCPAE